MANSKGNTEKAASHGVASATLRHVRIAPRKARLVVDLVRGLQVEPALQVLGESTKKGAILLAKLLRSALANAREKNADVDRLWVTGGWVNSAPTMKRIMPRARGSADQIHKKASHITIVVGEKGKNALEQGV